MSRKRGKHKKDAAEAVPAEVLAEGSGPVDVAAHVVTTDDIGTTHDVMTPDDVVEPAAAAAEAEPAPRSRKKKGKRGAKPAAFAAADPGDDSDDLSADVPVRTPDPNELNNAELADLIEAEAAREAAAAGGAEPASAMSASAESLEAESLEVGDGGDDGDGGDGDGDGDDEGDGEGEGEGDDEGASRFPTSAASMDSIQLKHLVESLVFASDKPITVQRLRQLTRVGDTNRLQLALTELEVDYRERGVVLQQVSGGFQFRTRTQFSAWVQQLIAGRPVRLSRAQLETLAIIAYRQPITRPEIDDIRGVDSSATLKLLLDRMLIRSLGKREEVGRPTLYGTTREFLDFFSLGDLRELPTLREYSELTAESRKVLGDRLGISPDDDDGLPGGGRGRGGGGSSGGGSSGSGGSGSDGGGGAGGGEPDAGSIVDGDAASAEPVEPGAHADAMSSFFAAADALDRADAAELDDDPAGSSDADGIPADLLAADDDSDEMADDSDGRVSEAGWPAGSEPVEVVAPIDVRPVERPSMDEQSLDATTLDADREHAPASHVDPAAE